MRWHSSTNRRILGVRAVELLPVLVFDGDRQWSYGTSLLFGMQSSAGGGKSTETFRPMEDRLTSSIAYPISLNVFIRIAGRDVSEQVRNR
jgi:hypothetical protein